MIARAVTGGSRRVGCTGEGSRGCCVVYASALTIWLSTQKNCSMRTLVLERRSNIDRTSGTFCARDGGNFVPLSVVEVFSIDVRVHAFKRTELPPTGHATCEMADAFAPYSTDVISYSYTGIGCSPYSGRSSWVRLG